MSEWTPVVFASDCTPCDCCNDLICHQYGEHYADCDCAGPMQDDSYEYKEVDGVLLAKPLEVSE
jgi:hypothetical protein